MLDKRKQYKEAFHTLNAELKETREKLEEAGLQNKELEEGLMTLRQRVEKARVDAVQKFKASQSYIDSCADYYGTEFDDCLKQVTSAFLELDLSRIIMEESVLTTPTGDTIASENDDPKNDNVVLA